MLVPVLRLPDESEEEDELELLDGDANEIEVLADGAEDTGPMELELEEDEEWLESELYDELEEE